MKLVIFLLTLVWAVDSVLAIWSATWKTTEWQIKDFPLWGHQLWKKITAANGTIWVTPIGSRGEDPFSDETGWNQAVD